MSDQLESLLDEGILSEVLGPLQSGKEAAVYLVRRGGELLAAKVYKGHRSFRNNAAYKEERRERNSRTQRAVARGSRFGRQAEEEAWRSAEADALYRLHAQGVVRVPVPVMFYEGVLLMQLVTDAEGNAAPRLIDAHLTAAQAGPLYEDLRRQMIGMLCCDVIHADLSPYNVLLGAHGPTIIDFPQMVSAAHNRQSEAFFLRDYGNLFTFLAGLDRQLQRYAGDGREIWRAYLRRELTPDYVPPVRSFIQEGPRGDARGPSRGPGGERGGGPPRGPGGERGGGPFRGPGGDRAGGPPRGPGGDRGGGSFRGPGGDRGGGPPRGPGGDRGGGAPPRGPIVERSGGGPPRGPLGDHGGGPAHAPGGDRGGGAPPRGPIVERSGGPPRGPGGDRGDGPPGGPPGGRPRGHGRRGH